MLMQGYQELKSFYKEQKLAVILFCSFIFN